MTNWDKFKETITPKMMANLIDTEWSELGGCTYCPEGCKAFCKACRAENEKLCDGEPYDEKLAFLFSCAEKISAWFQKAADK